MPEHVSRALPSFGELIAADLKALGFGRDAPAAPPVSAAPAHQPAIAHETDQAFIAALMPVAVACAVNGSIFNAGRDAGLSRLASIAPIDSTLADLKSADSALPACTDEDRALVRIASVHLALANVNTCGIRMLADEQRTISDDIWLATAKAWRDVTDVLLDLLVGIEVRHAGSRSEVLSLAAALQTTLMSVSQRGTPCLEKSGAIVLPGLAERRHGRRYPTDLAAILTIGGATHAIRITDISTRGYGVIDCESLNLDIGMSGILEIDGQPPRTVDVRWVRGDRAGLQRI